MSATPESPVSKTNESTAENSIVNEQQSNIETPSSQEVEVGIPKEVEIEESTSKEVNDTDEAIDDDQPLSKFEESLQLRDKMEALIRRTVQTKKRCDKLDHDNKYLQEYVGNLMNSGDFLSKRA
ncbi:hypothetical protein BN7_2356 [Wickerhamomyces ciferrii]|uniref:Uncharacterized protein n=1 Tax=Wickerhamomyces ciferrii (strain ATCC 14091 / BCRC 22168 / CBS 111 / JCM 3599 / NBRC 0793 / NRRL Y-1031 F-60-10) TaxID=1206466 RepID=K0KKY7_WICCF|nr:uncharacterized protein BN7_2356 [Wickerhamomyces ciferrii]CCH42812.1 hypothetical protein BN7_2356 [Wickerhamomyces ciferrii]